jgi:beta-galactosidase
MSVAWTKQFSGVALGLGLAILAALARAETAWKVSAIPDSDLTIPDENRFDAFEGVTLDNLAEVKLYRRYPESWQVVNLAGSWRGLKGDEPKPGAETAEDEVRRRTEAILKEGETVAVQITGKGGISTSGARAVSVATFEVDGADVSKSSFLLCFNRQGFAALYVNGRKAFDRSRGFDSFAGDITDCVQAGQNTVALVNGDWAIAWENELVVAPRSYVKQLLLTTDVYRSQLIADCLFVNRGEAGGRKLTARISSCSDKTGAVSYEDTVERPFQPGENAFVWSIRMMYPVYWSPDNPHLYEIQVFDESGAVVGRERFGFRDFSVKNGQFCLNDKPIKLFGSSSYGKFANLPGVPMKEGEGRDTFDKRLHYAYLRLWKQAHCNTIHSYGREYDRRGLYEACDELGMVAYSMFPGWGEILSKDFTAPEEGLKDLRDLCRGVLRYRYNHASFLMLSFGSELYTAKPENLAYVYHQVKAVDKQRRVMTSSSGRIGVALNRGDKDTLDFTDDHSYWGTMSDSWFVNGPHFRREKQRVAAMYGQNAKPLITSETLEPYLLYGYLSHVHEANRILNAEKVDRGAYAKFMVQPDEGLQNLILSRGLGTRKLVSDEAYGNRVIAELFQRVVEQVRQDDSLEGLLPFHITAFTPYAETALALARTLQDKRFAGMKVERTAIDPAQKAFIRTPQFYMMQRTFNPQLVSARWFDRDLIAGKGRIETTLYAVNDTPDPHTYAGNAVFRSPAGKALFRKDFDFGAVPSLARKTFPFAYPLPQNLETGDYRLELFLFVNGQRVSDNYYTVFVSSAEDVAYRAETSKKAAFYATPGTESGESASSGMLKAMKLKFDRLARLDALDRYQVLIIGSDSIDDQVGKHAANIIRWVENGGRLLCLAQSKTGYLPWFPDMQIVKAAPVAAIDIVDQKHPMYRGLKQEHFDTWNGDGYLFKFALDPLDKSVIAAGGTAYTLNRMAYTKSIVSDVAVGKGMMLLCQLELDRRYGQDGVATTVANNLVRYVLSDDRTFSEEVERSGRQMIYLDRQGCTFVDLKPHATASLLDNEAASDGKGGWDDYSDGNDCEVPTGEQRLNGIPYYIVPPEANQGRSVVMLHNPRLPWSVKSVKGIQVARKFHELHILHVGLSRVQDYTLTFHYEDGSTEKHDIRKQVHIGNWIKPPKGGWPQADFGWTGSTPMQPQVVLWHTKWTNPHPQKAVKTIDIEGPEDSGSCIVAMTLYEVVGEEGWEDKRIQEQKSKGPGL